MPRKAGAQNYKKEVLLEVMATFLPNQGSNSWDRVAAAYQEKSGEAELRDKEDLKRHWREKCCNKFKKPTGRSGAATDFILRCQRVQLLIHKKNESSLLGDGSGNSSDSNEDEDNDTSWMEELQEEGTSAALESVSVNNNTEIVSGVADVNSPSDGAVAAEEGVTVVNGAGNVSQFSCCHKIEFPYTDILLQESVHVPSPGPNEGFGTSRTSQNLTSLLERVPLANGDGELLLVDDEISGAGNLKTYSALKAPKSKNSSNVKRANVGKSIERLCDSIARSSEALLSPRMSGENNSQVFALQMFHSQMQNQDRKIEAIEKHTKAVGKMMKKLLHEKCKSKKKAKKKERMKKKRKTVKEQMPDVLSGDDGSVSSSSDSSSDSISSSSDVSSCE